MAETKKFSFKKVAPICYATSIPFLILFLISVLITFNTKNIADWGFLFFGLGILLSAINKLWDYRVSKEGK